jgi:methenyltetrahydrofolate cyclohydrolase
VSYRQLTVQELLEAIGAKTPAPASGTAAAFTAALAAALAELAARVSDDADAAERAVELRARLAALADEDADAYAAFVRTRGDEERDRTIEVPLALAETAAEAAALAERLAEHGKRSVVGDALAAADLAHAAVRAAARLVEINVHGAEDPRVVRARELACQSAAWLQQPPDR